MNRIGTVATVALLCASWLVEDRSSPAKSGPEVGKPAPVFRLNDHDGDAVAIGGESDNWMLLAFYPKAMTPG